MIYLSLVVDTERLQEFIKELWEMKWKWRTEARLMQTEELASLGDFESAHPMYVIKSSKKV